MRREPRSPLLALAGALCLLALAWPAHGSAAERPNFVHVLTDDQTIDSLRSMPHTKRLLKRRGTTFANHHATQPLCCPSRASLLTGQYPHNHGVLNNLSPFGYAAMDFSRTLYTAMDEAGYRTGWIGKVLNDPDGLGREPEPGFDEWYVPQLESQHDMFDYTLSDNGELVEVEGIHQNTLYGPRAERFIEAAGQPFLLTLSIFSPHFTFCEGSFDRCPPDPEPADRGSFRGERFPLVDEVRGGRDARREANRWWRRELESMRSVDRIVRDLVRALRKRDELDHTYLIFQSDNGMLHGEHGVFDKNVPWDRSVRIPLLIRGPGFERERRRDLTANVDVPATILGAAGVAEPLPGDGYSLLGKHRRRYLLLERLRGPAPWRQIKTASDWTYWEWTRSGKRRLYDLDRDPQQTRNLVRREPERARRLHRKLRRAADCAAPCP